MNMIEAMNNSGSISLQNYLNYIKDGLIMEFGVATGDTINRLARNTKGRTVYGFDSFQGLPENWRPEFGAGSFKQDKLPWVEANVELVVGLFADTLPTFLQEHTDPVAFIHIDCDLYSSTKCVFDNLKDRMQDGTIIAFDEIRSYQGFEQHEYKAFNEFLEETKYQWECIGNHGGEQAGFRIYK
jgi:Macrocin-O-methyltransferase (TylF)